MHHEYYRKVLTHFCNEEDVVIVAPLNWGLGHAARCIPIIQFLESRCKKVLVAADGEALKLLQLEFPHLENFELASYKVRYRYKSIFLNILSMVPSMLRAIFADLRAADKLVKHSGATVIISDNRLTFRSKGTVNLYITHQYHILHTYNWVGRLASKLHQYFIRKYNACLIPDFSGSTSLCPALSGTEAVGKFFMGPITRIHKKPQTTRWDIVFLPTGPEPQRSVFAGLISAELSRMSKYRILMIGSKSLSEVYTSPPAHIEVIEWPDTQKMETILNASRLLISRSGYTTCMDIFHLSLRAILIPTPGQTEQEYLAAFHKNRLGIKILEQNQINIIQKTIKSLI